MTINKHVLNEDIWITAMLLTHTHTQTRTRTHTPTTMTNIHYIIMHMQN